ncbi:UDP-glycosyltransferase UGT5-like [Coccinella septempunctata]|uniref:UDP-glycosyltransferase UGT5-like n=1 Tax=Coccinella septempunctata TaxID=41139 RepID=UPI001D05F8C9|nr:UDP-glycosyltransferase UGT5-like [Coccinella septempunctata]
MLYVHRSLALCVFFGIVNSARILGVFYSPGFSHFIAGSTLMSVLAERGHNVTVVSPFSREASSENYEEIYLDGLFNKSWSRSASLFKKRQNPFLLALIANKLSAPFLTKFMSHPKFQELINGNRTFDLVIVEQFACEALFYLGTHFKAPLIGFSTIDASQWTNRYVGNPTFPAYIPDILLPFDKMTYWQRMQNTLIYLLQEVLFHYQRIPAQQQILEDNFPAAPRLEDFMYNISLTFLNADLSFHNSIPKVPSMIDIGGFHINPPKALPQDLQEVLDNSTNGVIYFSMGTSVRSKDMPEEQLNAFMEVFSKLKETVLWKWENESLPRNLKNVITRKWFPQQDILRHKNVKMFITHGGLFSMMESLNSGIPMLTIPIKADQFLNSARAERGGYAKSIDFLEISESTLTLAIKELLEIPRYKQNAEWRSYIMNLKPRSPRETLIFWTEYVIKFRGAPHLRVSSLDIPWYQYMLLDVLPLIVLPPCIFLIVVILLSFYLVKLIVRFCCGECDSGGNVVERIRNRWKILLRSNNDAEKPAEEALQLLKNNRDNHCEQQKSVTLETDH